MTSKEVVSFVTACINNLEAGGYQELEEANEEGHLEVPEGATPDEWGRLDDRTLYFVFQGEEFTATFTKKRKK